MKRYSIAVADGRKDNKVHFHYYGRTDNPEEAIAKYRKSFTRWCQNVQDVKNEEHEIAHSYHGIRITDSLTKEAVFEESHISEELGWKKEYEEVVTKSGIIVRQGHWVKI